MTKHQIHDEILSFLSTFKDKDDIVIAAILFAWFSNNIKNEYTFMRSFIEKEMKGKPSSFLKSYMQIPYDMERYDEKGNASFFGVISFKNLHELLCRIYETINLHGGFENVIATHMNNPTKHKVKYVHEALAMILGNDTMFPTRNNNGTFYRYNLLLYWLVYKLQIWCLEDYKKRILIPCDEQVFIRAYDLGFVNKHIKPNRDNTITLTNIARMRFGDDIHKMYELLAYGIGERKD